jgi:hypothetical protein
MKLRLRIMLMLTACLLVLGLAVLAVGCGDGKTATTEAPTTTVAAPTTTEGATETTAEAPAATSGTMIVKGKVDDPKTLTVDDLKAMDVTTITAEHPKMGPTEYTGVLVKDIMEAVGVQSDAAALVMGASDGFMGQVDISELDADSMISISDDGKLNAVMPGQTGKAWVSDIVTLDFQ